MISDHPSYTTSVYFWTFFNSLTHPLCQHQYSTESQQKWPSPNLPPHFADAI